MNGSGWDAIIADAFDEPKKGGDSEFNFISIQKPNLYTVIIGHFHTVWAIHFLSSNEIKTRTFLSQMNVYKSKPFREVSPETFPGHLHHSYSPRMTHVTTHRTCSKTN